MNILLLVLSMSWILNCGALTITDNEESYRLDQKYIYADSDEPSDDVGSVEYYRPPTSRRVRIPSAKYEDPPDFNEDPNYPQGYELVPTTENYPYEIADYPPVTKRIRTTKKPVTVEQFLKEVTPTTKIAYQQYTKFNNQRRRIDNIRDQIEESHPNDVKRIPEYQYVLPQGIPQVPHTSQSHQYPYDIPDPKSLQPQQISEINPRPQYVIYTNRPPSHKKIVEINPNQHSSQSSIYVSTSLPNKPVRKIIKPKPSPVDEDMEYYSQLQQYQQQLQLKQQLRQKQQLQRLKQQQIQQQQERRQKIQQQLVQEQQLLQQQILQKQIQQQRLQEANLRHRTEIQQPLEVKYQSKPQKYPKEDSFTRDSDDVKYYQQQGTQYDLEYKTSAKPEVIQYNRNLQTQRKQVYKNPSKQNPTLSAYSIQEPWKPIIPKNIPNGNNYYYPTVTEDSEHQDLSSQQQDEVAATKYVSYQQSNIQELDKHQQQALRHIPKQSHGVNAETRPVPYRLADNQQIGHPSVNPEYVENTKNVQLKTVIYQNQNEDEGTELYDQPSTVQQPSLLKYHKSRLQIRGRPQILQQPEENQQEGLDAQYLKPHELSNYRKNDQENINFKPNPLHDARLYRNLRPSATY